WGSRGSGSPLSGSGIGASSRGPSRKSWGLRPGVPHAGITVGCAMGERVGDASRHDVLPLLAREMGLDTRSERSLWIDRALLEMNVAVNHSFAKAKISLWVYSVD